MNLVREKPLAALSMAALALCLVGVLSFLATPLTAKSIFGSLALTTWVAFPAAYNLARGLGTSTIARSWRAALILSIPSALSVALIAWARFGMSDPQSPLALFLWPLGFFILLPITWAFGRGYHENYERPVPNNSFKPNRLRRSA